ncbi:MAG TPA: hypothetical protein VF760_00625 [Xanthobacteraceae bacterium]
MIKPTIGRKLWFHPGEGDDLWHGEQETQPCDATIAYVWNDRLVNLTVADHNGYTRGRSSVPLVQPGDERPTSKQSYCEWMPFQIGQSQAVKDAQAAGGVLAERE